MKYIKLISHYLGICIGLYIVHFLFVTKFEYFSGLGYLIGASINIFLIAVTSIIMLVVFKSRKENTLTILMIRPSIFMLIFLSLDVIIEFLIFGKLYYYDHVINDIPFAFQSGLILELFRWIYLKNEKN